MDSISPDWLNSVSKPTTLHSDSLRSPDGDQVAHSDGFCRPSLDWQDSVVVDMDDAHLNAEDVPPKSQPLSFVASILRNQRKMAPASSFLSKV